ncbi:MAG: helix-turn-helix transcriptional regulator [Poseidonibacter sp.]|uniref:helix-turn-helix transcriptional regulator n=1 Tax=Poseidonibacter sp. TaxID=2321188 RepID=UPI00359EDA90
MAYKHDYDKTLTRLVSILTKLYNGDALYIKNLAEEFNVSTRTIQRDLNERLISFPIEKKGRMWKMQDGFKIEKSSTLEEQVVLDIMENIFSNVGKMFSLKAKSLLSRIKNEDCNPIYAKISMESIDDKLLIIQKLEVAIKQKKQIICSYKLQENKTYELTVNPLKIANFEGFWYLIAIDTKDGFIKKYYLKSIFNIKIKEELFTINSKIEGLLKNSINVWFNENTDPFVVKLYIDSSISKFIERKPLAPTQIVESINRDGSLIVTIKITHEMEIISLIKYWIPNVKVIEPVWIDDIIKKDIAKY